jgi:hypothetical protein
MIKCLKLLIKKKKMRNKTIKKKKIRTMLLMLYKKRKEGKMLRVKMPVLKLKEVIICLLNRDKLKNKNSFIMFCKGKNIKMIFNKVIRPP